MVPALRPLPCLLSFFLAWFWIGKGCAESRAETEAAEVAKLPTDLLNAKADSAGWETRLTVAAENLQAGLLKEALRGDSAEAREADLLQELEAAGARIISLTDLVAEPSGRVTDTVRVHVGADACSPDSVTAEVDDGLLEGRWVYWPPTSLFDLPSSANRSDAGGRQPPTHRRPILRSPGHPPGPGGVLTSPREGDVMLPGRWERCDPGGRTR